MFGKNCNIVLFDFSHLCTIPVLSVQYAQTKTRRFDYGTGLHKTRPLLLSRSGIPAKEKVPVTRYGRMFGDYLKKNNRFAYNKLLFSSRLNRYLAELGEQAEKMLIETQQTYVPPVSGGNGHLSADMLFANYMEMWLEIVCSSVEKTTFSSYTQIITPYFHDTGLTLSSIQANHIQSFYLHELKSVSASTVIHEHADIYKALKYAVKMDLNPFNPADKVERPKKQKYIADYYHPDESEKLFEVTKRSSVFLADSDNRILRAETKRST